MTDINIWIRFPLLESTTIIPKCGNGIAPTNFPITIKRYSRFPVEQGHCFDGMLTSYICKHLRVCPYSENEHNSEKCCKCGNIRVKQSNIFHTFTKKIKNATCEYESQTAFLMQVSRTYLHVYHTA